MATVRLRNTNPLGQVDLPLIGRSLEPGEEFELDSAAAKELLKQAGNYERVETKPPLKANKQPTKQEGEG